MARSNRGANAAKLNARKRKSISTIDTYEKILIVCEGEKTEPNYFNEVISYYKINAANVFVTGNCGSDPNSVFDKAKQLYKEEEKKGDAYDRVYCVFDKDEHSNFEATCRQIKNKRPSKTFFCTTSIPCFEYWLLLHFEDTDRCFLKTQNKSASDCVVSSLKKYIPNYSKKQKDLFSMTVQHSEEAKERAKRIEKRADVEHADPSTKVYELVDFLQNIKKRRPQ